MAAVSTFSWLDHRDEDQQRVREALAAFDQPGIVDPLGFGAVRDTFSDMLFPGLSTVQTRARYFLLVPWAYRRLDVEKVPPSEGARRARELEVASIAALCKGSEDQNGIIGRYSQAATKQLPSFIYWGGLGRLGIRGFPGTRQEYVATIPQRRSRGATGEDPWPGLPPEPDGIFEEATLRLSPEEAEFLQDRILRSTRGTYLELLVRDGGPNEDGDLPWTHPQAAEAPPTIMKQLEHAELFSYTVWGASLIYNSELSRLLEADGQAPLPQDYDELLERWIDEVTDRQSELAAWDREDLWWHVTGQNPRAAGARGFVDWWLDTAITDPRATASSSDVRRQLQQRESKVKGPRAKLATRRARERSPNAQGGGLMSFRWAEARQIVDDIHEGTGVHA